MKRAFEWNSDKHFNKRRGKEVLLDPRFCQQSDGDSRILSLDTELLVSWRTYGKHTTCIKRVNFPTTIKSLDYKLWNSSTTCSGGKSMQIQGFREEKVWILKTWSSLLNQILHKSFQYLNIKRRLVQVSKISQCRIYECLPPARVQKKIRTNREKHRKYVSSHQMKNHSWRRHKYQNWRATAEKSLSNQSHQQSKCTFFLSHISTRMSATASEKIKHKRKSERQIVYKEKQKRITKQRSTT